MPSRPAVLSSVPPTPLLRSLAPSVVITPSLSGEMSATAPIPSRMPRRRSSCTPHFSRLAPNLDFSLLTDHIFHRSLFYFTSLGGSLRALSSTRTSRPTGSSSKCYAIVSLSCFRDESHHIPHQLAFILYSTVSDIHKMKWNRNYPAVMFASSA